MHQSLDFACPRRHSDSVEELRITVREKPVGQPRPRAARIGNNIRIYNPPTADAWRLAVELAATEAARDQEWEQLTEPAELKVVFWMPRPKAHYRAAKPAPWVPCDCCDGYICNIHKTHAHDCPCPPADEWEVSPYDAPKPELKPTAPLYCHTKPDLSNLLKGTEDELETAGVIRGDQLIVAIDTVKLYGPESAVGANLTLSKATSRTKVDNHG